METAIAQSCDVYFYELSDKLGVDRLAEFLGHFGFGATTGLDIGGERKGILPTPAWKKARYKSTPSLQAWFPGETVIYGIGQGSFIVTPMQLAHMTATMASRGKSYQPRLVRALREQGTGKVTNLEPKLLETVAATPENWKVALDGMVKVMSGDGGTGRRSQVGAEYQIAGKTGTAQVFTVAQNEKYKESELNERLHDHGLFVAFAPADAPKIAVAVIVENGKHGSSVAPIARRVMDQYLLGRTTTPEIPPPEKKALEAPPTSDQPGDE
jgi:penicillin-binding protein 2